jgi:hypothetical protein
MVLLDALPLNVGWSFGFNRKGADVTLDLTLIAEMNRETADLEEAIQTLSHVKFHRLKTPTFVRIKTLDALFLPLTRAEKWGSQPIIHGLDVIKVNEDWLPSYILTGLCLAPNDPKDAIFGVRLLLSTTQDVVTHFNEHAPRKIRVVGVLLGHMRAQEIDVDTLVQTLKDVWKSE